MPNMQSFILQVVFEFGPLVSSLVCAYISTA